MEIDFIERCPTRSFLSRWNDPVIWWRLDVPLWGVVARSRWSCPAVLPLLPGGKCLYIANTYLSPNTHAHTYLRTQTHRGRGPARGSCAQSKFIYDTSLSDCCYSWSLCLVWCHSGHAASGGALGPEPPRATRSQPELYGFVPKIIFFPQNSRLSLLWLKRIGRWNSSPIAWEGHW